MLEPPGRAATEEELLSEQIRDVLADRAQRELTDAVLRTSGVGPEVPLTETIAPRAFLGIPGLDCIDDFVKYLLDDSIREQVIERFTRVVRPLLEQGASVEVISHSWGTVVSYEALRLLEDAAGRRRGSVHNLFTVGSALSIPPVKRWLLPAARDGRRPADVEAWVNLDARFDMVGGMLRQNPFEVDYEYLDLGPTGCSLIIPNPACAHGSYFHPDNLIVNRGIFARHIEG